MRVAIFLVVLLISCVSAPVVIAQEAGITSQDASIMAVDSAWVKRYNGPGNGYDEGAALAVDSAGNVYVTGTSYSGASDDYATIKYGPDGTRLWVRRYDGPGKWTDAATAIAVDNLGNISVTGNAFSGAATSHDFTTIKYAPDGTRLWVRKYDGPGNGTDWATALAVDATGNVYVTGMSYAGPSATDYWDYATIKYDPDGKRLWVRRYNGPAKGADEPKALVVDAQGNVYVTGSSWNSTSWDYATIKYGPDGARLWVRRYNGRVNGDDEPAALAVDAQGNVYVTGYSTGDGTSADYVTIKYAPDGAFLWLRRYNGPANKDDQAQAMGVDGQGNVYVTGRSAGEGANWWDFATIKYAPDGDRLWVRRYNGPANDADGANALALDAQGNVYVTGYSVGTEIYSDYATIKYSPEGHPLWVMRYDGPADVDSTDNALAIAVDPQNNVYITGYSPGINFNNDCATIKYSQAP